MSNDYDLEALLGQRSFNKKYSACGQPKLLDSIGQGKTFGSKKASITNSTATNGLNLPGAITSHRSLNNVYEQTTGKPKIGRSNEFSQQSSNQGSFRHGMIQLAKQQSAENRQQFDGVSHQRQNLYNMTGKKRMKFIGKSIL